MTTAESAPLFVSVFELRAGHHDLLLKQHELVSVDRMRDEVRLFVERARDSGRYLHGEEHRVFAQAVIDYWTAALYRDSKVEVRKATLDVFDPAFAPDLPRDNCPYVGLQPFDETASHLFFGRMQQVKEMVALLETQRLLCVIGQSGTGKSSLVRAGLIPMLRRGTIPGSDAWRYLGPIVPGAEPLVAMARLLVPPDVVPREQIAEHVRKLRQSPSYLVTRVAAEKRPVFLLVDQFEELFTQCGSEADRNAFAANLASLVRAKDLPHRVVLTVRSDYETHLVQLRAIEQLVRKGEVRVSALNASELRAAIEGPARLVGLTFDDGVVTALVNETLGEPAALPLLQFALQTLWTMKDRNRIPISAYQKLGGAVRALGREADRIFGGLTPEQQAVAERIFSRIVRPAPGSETTSRRASMSELVRRQNPESVRDVVRLLVEARLLRMNSGSNDDDTYVELMHEALSRNWNRLIQWTDRLRVHILTQDRLEAAAQEWLVRGESVTLLLDEERLRDAEKWLASPEARDLDASPLLLEFIAVSRKRVDETTTRERRLRQRAFTTFVTAMILLTVSVTIGFLLALAERDAANAEAARAVAEAARASTKGKLDASEAAYLRFLRKNDGDKVKELRTRFLEPLERDNAFLKISGDMTAAEKRGLESQLAAETARATALEQERVRLSAEIGRITAELEELQRQNREAKEVAGRLTEQLNTARTQVALEKMARRIEEVRPSAAPELPAPAPSVPPASPPPLLPASVRLRIGDSVGTARAAGSARICCFLKTLTDSHYFLSAGAALNGDPGDVIYTRTSSGEQYRVGVIWKNIGAGDGSATVVHLFDEVKYNEIPPTGRSFWGTEDDVDVGHTVQILTREGTAKGIVNDSRADKLVVTVTGTPLLGAPAVNTSHELIGLVTAISGTTVTITPIDALIKEVRRATLDD